MKKVYKYDEWDMDGSIPCDSFYVDISGEPITGILEGFWGYTSDTSDPKNSQEVINGKRVSKVHRW